MTTGVIVHDKSTCSIVTSFQDHDMNKKAFTEKHHDYHLSGKETKMVGVIAMLEWESELGNRTCIPVENLQRSKELDATATHPRRWMEILRSTHNSNLSLHNKCLKGKRASE